MRPIDLDDVAVVAFDGLDELDALGPYEVFSNASAAAGGEVTVSLAALDGADSVTGGHGTTFDVDRQLRTDHDLVVVPGGGWNDDRHAGVRAEVERGSLPEHVRECRDDGAVVASVCTGAMVLGEAGLLDGRPATTHASAMDDLATYGADAVDARVVDDGDVLTAAGVTAGLDLALWIVESALGEAVAADVATEMEYERSTAVESDV